MFLEKEKNSPNEYRIPTNSKYEKMACKFLEDGVSAQLCAAILSSQMNLDGLEQSVSRKAVLSLIKRLNPIRTNVKKLPQSGKEFWVIARYNWSLHLLVRMGYHNDDTVKWHIKHRFGNDVPDWLNQKKLEVEGFTFSIFLLAHFDEVHIKQVVGLEALYQLRFK